MPYLILTYLPSLLCAVHIVRTGRPMFWLWIVIIVPGIGPAIYLFVEWLPELLGGRTARKIGQQAKAAIDPDRAYREAKAALADIPSVQNRLKLAEACLLSERFAEAEGHFREALQGIHQDDATLLLGHGRALLELSRPQEALAPLLALEAQGALQAPLAQLTYARTLDALGRRDEAEVAYRAAAIRFAGLEALARLAEFLQRVGKAEEARDARQEIDRRAARTPGPFRNEARRWRAFAYKSSAAQTGPA